MIAPHTRAICNECATSVIVQADGEVFRCNCCEAIIINSVSPIASSLGVSAVATVDVAPGPSVATATFSRDCASQAPGPSLATGMSRDPANAGGEHEAVTAISLNDTDIDCAFETGTSPGACGTERERVGATNSNPDRGYMGRRLNPALGTSVVACGEAPSDVRNQLSMASRLRSPGPQDSNPNPVSMPIPTPVLTALRSYAEAAPLFLSVDPELEAAIRALEAKWSPLGISLSDCIMNNSISLRSRAMDSMSDNFVQASASSSISTT